MITKIDPSKEYIIIFSARQEQLILCGKASGKRIELMRGETYIYTAYLDVTYYEDKKGKITINKKFDNKFEFTKNGFITKLYGKKIDRDCVVQIYGRDINPGSQQRRMIVRRIFKM